ncbi:hypothetical protein GN956_G26628 [Arapaima gigas]
MDPHMPFGSRVPTRPLRPTSSSRALFRLLPGCQLLRKDPETHPGLPDVFKTRSSGSVSSCQLSRQKR